jgi:hypothetical protein
VLRLTQLTDEDWGVHPHHLLSAPALHKSSVGIALERIPIR